MGGPTGRSTGPATARDPGWSSAPVALSTLVGRAGPVREVAALVGRTRLVTLVGAGGAGKTRLAAEVASRLTLPVAWVDLAPLTDAARLPSSVARAVGVHQAADGLEAVTVALTGRPAVLVLDNCEHLAGSVADLVVHLLTELPELAVLAASRVPLQVSGERLWRVPSLDLPPVACAGGDLDGYAAARLFLDRATAAGAALDGLRDNPALVAAVVTIVRRLDGIPLALELAAARAAVLSLPELADRLDDALELLGDRGPDRQATLRSTLDWSWELLEPRDREVLVALGCFAPTFTVADVESVVGGPGSVGTVHRLVDRSWVSVVGHDDSPHRLRLHEVVRQYVAERAAGSSDLDAVLAAATERHATHLLARMRTLDELLRWGRGAERARARREAESWRANLIGALAHLSRPEADEQDAEDLRALAVASWWSWWLHSDFAEGLRWLDAAVAHRPGPPAPGDWVAADLAHGRGWLGRHLGASPSHLRDLRTAAAAYPTDAHGDLSVVWHRTAALCLDLGRTEEAVAAVEVSLREAASAGHPWVEGAARYWRGIARGATGDLAEAIDDLRRGEELFADAGDGWARGRAQGMASAVLVRQGRLREASALLAEARATSSAAHDRWGLARWDLHQAELHHAAGRAEAGAQAAEASRAAFAALGDVRRADEAAALMVPGGPPGAALVEGLSPRELDVLALVARGLSDAEVAARLVLSVRTVGGHLGSAYRKLGVRSRTAAVHRASELGLLEDEEEPNG